MFVVSLETDVQPSLPVHLHEYLQPLPDSVQQLLRPLAALLRMVLTSEPLGLLVTREKLIELLSSEFQFVFRVFESSFLVSDVVRLGGEEGLEGHLSWLVSLTDRSLHT